METGQPLLTEVTQNNQGDQALETGGVVYLLDQVDEIALAVDHDCQALYCIQVGRDLHWL